MSTLTLVVEDRDVGLVDARPEGVEVGVTLRTAVGVPRPQVDRAGTRFDHSVELLDGVIEIAKRDMRRTEDPVLVREAPIVLDPAVQGAEVGVERL